MTQYQMQNNNHIDSSQGGNQHLISNTTSNPSFTDYDLSIRTVEQQLQGQNRPNENDHEQSLAQDQFELPGIMRFKSDNDEVIKDLLRQKQKSVVIEDKKVCIQDICLEESRQMISGQHDGHKIMEFRSLLRELEMLKCNYHFTNNNPQEVISLLNSLDMVFHEILLFEQQISGLFNQLKLSSYHHIKAVKDSFSFKYYQQVKDELLQDFSYSNVRFALQEIQKFKKIKYPNLQYPSLKIKMIKKTLNQINLDHNIHIIQKTNKWIQHLLASNKKDIKVKRSRSIYTFMNMGPSEKSIFSQYMKSQEYALTDNSKILVRQRMGSDNVPFAVIQKQLTRQVQIKVCIQKMEKSIFIGFAPLKELQKFNYQNVAKSKFAHLITNNGQTLPIGSQNYNLRSIPFKFAEHDVVSIIRTNNLISFIKNAHLKNPERYEVHLSLEQYSMSLYPCVHLSSTASILKIVK